MSEIIQYLEKNKARWISTKELIIELSKHQASVNRQMNQLVKYGFCVRKVENKMHFIKLKW